MKHESTVSRKRSHCFSLLGFCLLLSGCGIMGSQSNPLSPTSKLIYINRGATFPGEDGDLFIRAFNFDRNEFIDDYGVVQHEMTAGISVLMDDRQESFRIFFVYLGEVITYYSYKIHILRFGDAWFKGFLEVDVTSASEQKASIGTIPELDTGNMFTRF